MARKPTGNPTGRPEKEVDWNLFEQLCDIQCTQIEIASFLKIHDETLAYKVKDKYGEDYSTTYKKLAQGGKCSLRRNQFVLSKTNASMAIWLGKQWLGQTDLPQEINVSNETLKQFSAIMQQIDNAQSSALKIADINKSNDSTS